MAAGPAASPEFGEGQRQRLTLVRGEGAYLFDDRGRRFVDLGATHGVGNLGAVHPAVVRAVRDQAAELIHLGSGYASPVRTAFLERLLSLLPSSFSRAFLSNSGTEAVEAAIKIARSATGRPKVVAARRTLTALTTAPRSAACRANPAA